MRILAASIASAIALFLFGFVWWGVLMPVVKPAKVLSDPALVAQMSSTLSESAVYFYPDPAVEPADATGPMAILYFNTDMPNMGKMMGLGLGHMFVVSLLAATWVATRNLTSFGERFKHVFLLGLFVALWADIGNFIWWRHPASWAFYNFGYDILSWSIAGAIIAAVANRDIRLGS